MAGTSAHSLNMPPISPFRTILHQLILPILLYLNHSISPLDSWIWDPTAHVKQNETTGGAMCSWLAIMCIFQIGSCYRHHFSVPTSANAPFYARYLSSTRFSPFPIEPAAFIVPIADCAYKIGIIHERWVLLSCAFAAGCANALLLETICTVPPITDTHPTISPQRLTHNPTQRRPLITYLVAFAIKILALTIAYLRGVDINPFTEPARVWWMLGIHALCGTCLNHYLPRFFPTVFLHFTVAVRDGVRVPLRLAVARKYVSLIQDNNNQARRGERANEAAVGTTTHTRTDGNATAQHEPIHNANSGQQSSVTTPIATSSSPTTNTQPSVTSSAPSTTPSTTPPINAPSDPSNPSYTSNTITTSNTTTTNPSPTSSTTTHPQPQTRIDLHILNATFLEFIAFGLSNSLYHFLTDDTPKAREGRKLAPMLFAAGLHVVPP